MTRILEGSPAAAGLRVGIVVSRFNEVITSRLQQGAEGCLSHHGGAETDRTVVRVPGAWELPQAVRRLIGGGAGFDAIVVLGAIVRGDTPHFDYLATSVTAELAGIARESGIALAYGLLTTETVEQATERAGGKHGNKGWDAALSAIEMADLFRRMG